MSRLSIAQHNMPAKPSLSPPVQPGVFPPKKKPVPSLAGAVGLPSPSRMPGAEVGIVGQGVPRSSIDVEMIPPMRATMPRSAALSTPEGKQWLQDTLDANGTTSLSRKPPASALNFRDAVWRSTDVPSGPVMTDGLLRKDSQGRQVDQQGNVVPGGISLLNATAPRGQGPIAGITRPAPDDPKTPEEALQRINALKDTADRIRNGIAPPGSQLPQTQATSDQLSAEGERYRQSLDNPVMPSNLSPQGQEAWGARQQEIAGQRRAVSVQDMLSGNGTRAMGENGMPIRNGSGAPLPNTVQGSVGADGSPVYRPDGSRMVEPVGGWGAAPSTGQMIPRTEQERARDSELLDAARYKSDMRAQQRAEIEQAGGFGGPRPGMLGGLMDRVMGPQAGPDARNFSRPGFADDVIRMEAAKAKRERYLNSQGEYAGRGRAERQAVLQERKDRVAARGMEQAANRTARIEARKAASLPMNPMQAMAMRNPALALGMQRIQNDAQQADLDRQIQRQELEIRRDALRGEQDDRKQARLDAMTAQKAQLQLEQQRLGQEGELGRAGIAQDQQQHDRMMQQGEERLAEVKRQGTRADQEVEQAKRDRYTALYNQVALENRGWSPQQIRAEVDRRNGTIPEAAAGANPDAGTSSASPTQTPKQFKVGDMVEGRLSDLYKTGDFATFEAEARAAGYDKDSIDAMYQTLSGRGSARRGQPEGQGFMGALSDPVNMPFRMSQWLLGQ